jgi:pimeloyl-ACP methyl ester carboxylesterase
MITGLGLSGGAWWRTVPVLARGFQVITFDSRGLGRSRGAPAYTTEAMADDAVSVLDAAALASAHVYGFSLGGMVAQQLVLRHPERVRSLVLGATQPGGPRAIRAGREVVRFFGGRASMRAEDAARASVPFNYGPRCIREHPERIDEDIARRLEHGFDAAAYRGQLLAASLHNAYSRLNRIAVPTLVVHGRQDRVIPFRNAEIMAARIPRARLLLLEESGHLYTTEEPDVDHMIAAFLQEVSDGHVG